MKTTITKKIIMTLTCILMAGFVLINTHPKANAMSIPAETYAYAKTAVEGFIESKMDELKENEANLADDEWGWRSTDTVEGEKAVSNGNTVICGAMFLIAILRKLLRKVARAIGWVALLIAGGLVLGKILPLIGI